MERAFSELTTNLERAQQAVARERIARARGDSDVDDEAEVLARHRWVSERSAKDILGELRDRRFVDETGLAAIAFHLRSLERERVLASSRASLRRLPQVAVVIDDHGTRLDVAIAELASGGRPERVRGLELGIDAIALRVAGSLADRVGESRESTRDLDALASVDLDRPLAKLDERARAFLDATDSLADEMLDFLRGRHGGEIRTITSLWTALRRRELDDAAKPVSRARRMTDLLRLASFGTRVERHAAVDASAPGLVFGVELVLPKPSEVRLLPGRTSQGILAELAFVEATGRALTILESYPGLPDYLVRPRRGRLGRVIGTLLVRAAFDTRRLRALDAPEVALERTRRVAATATLLRTRLAATRALGLTTSDHLERATRVAWLPGATALASVHGDVATEFDALGSGLAWARALRELYDEDFLRHASTREWLGTVFARAAIEAPETFETEIGATETAASELRSWFDGRV